MEDWQKIEENILKFWEDNRVFEKSLAKRKGRKPFIFFEGPPSANAKPGIHHFIGRAFKDLFNRYRTMRGFYVERKSGWDTHGLPIEIAVEKKLGLKSKKEIEEYGIAAFNRQARATVWQYKEEWEKFTKRIGFWLDLKHPYITYDPSYIESLWAIIKDIWQKGFLYQGYKVVPFCTRCGTPLSSHEVAQGYKNISEPSVYVKFKLIPGQKIGQQFTTDDRTFILAWTTTPWTLPGNVALAVGQPIDYAVLVRDGENYILAKDLVEKVFPQTNYQIVKEFKGADILDLEYQPLFEVTKLKSKTSYRIYPADFVTTSEGTGVVHTAVMYGEDDYSLGLKFDLPRHHTVDQSGRFTKDVPELAGRYVKEAEGEIIAKLKNRGALLKAEDHAHDYPFCWRCATPLLYYATDSWFVAMSKLEKDLVKNNKKINWVPAHLKEGRFGEWLRGIKDWAFSRERYWGTPLPIWTCQKCGQMEVVGSFEDLEKKRWKKGNDYYFMRHGFSTKNQDTVINSRLENDHYSLTAEGIKQVKAEAEKLKKLGIDFIYSSPFLRTKETAEIVAEAVGLKVQTDERLKELDHGSACENQQSFVCLADDSQHRHDLYFRFGDGESWATMRQRMMDFMKAVDAKHEGQKILIVSHGDPLAALIGTMRGWSDDQLLDILAGKRGKDLEAAGESRVFYPKKGRFYRAKFKNWPWNEEGALDPHRPFIDEIALCCGHCAGPMRRVKDVVDVWFDSGAMPLAQWHYPFENKDKFKKNFPADFIAEGVDQTRGWFYTLLAVSTLLGRGPAYKNVLSYGHVLDAQGQKMSKSKGNAIDPGEVVEKYGADAARWYFYSVNSPGETKLFSMEEVAVRWRGFLMIVGNALRFFELYAGSRKKFSVDLKSQLLGNSLDRWLLSRWHRTLQAATAALDAFDPTTASRAIEQLAVEDFSKWWLRRSRNYFQRPAGEKELVQSLSFLRFFLLELSKVLAPFIPFAAEHIHLQLRGSGSAESSVHTEDWPKFNKKFIDEKLEEEMALIQKITTLGLAIRQKEKIKVRQPLGGGVVWGASEVRPELQDLIKDELNLKDISWGRYQEHTQPEDYSEQEEGGIKVALLTKKISQELVVEGWAREMVRQIQDLRKEAKCHFQDKILAYWQSDNQAVREAVEKWSNFIKRNSLLKSFSLVAEPEAGRSDWQKEWEISPGKKIWVGIKR